MDILLVGVLAAIAIVAVTAIAPRLGVSAPLTLVVFGVILSVLPFVTVPQIEPEWILAGVLPPLLYSASVAMPTMDFRRDFFLISGLSVVLVVISSVLVGLLFYALIPGISLATGIALGAVVSPTDAVATSIVRKLGVSARLVTILEGESLLNDATALVVLRAAVAAMATAAGSFSLGRLVGGFALAVLIAVAIGFAVGAISLMLRWRITDASVNTAISLIVPFVAYIPTEHLGGSGLVAAVVAGLVAGAGSARFLRPADRIAEESNWHTLNLLLEGAIFLLMGLQLDALVKEAASHHGSIWLAIGMGALAALAILVVRTGYLAPLLWLLNRRVARSLRAREYLTEVQQKLNEGDPDTFEAVGRRGLADDDRPLPGARRRAVRRKAKREALRRREETAAKRREARAERRREHERRSGERRAANARRQIARANGRLPDDAAHNAQILSRRITQRVADIDYIAGEKLGPREGALLVWAGMRGAVTLAAAQTLPDDTPYRATLVLIAFVVAAGTLLLQGSSLPWLVRRLDLMRSPDGDVDDRRRLRAVMRDAAASALSDAQLRQPDGRCYPSSVMNRVKEFTRQEDEELSEEEASKARAAEAAQVRRIRLRVIEAQRSALLDARRLGVYSSAALRDALAILDADQMSAELREDQPG